MDIELLQEQIFDAVQQQRVLKEMPEFRMGDVPYLQYTYHELKIVPFTVQLNEDENEMSMILSEFVNMLDENQSYDEDRLDHHSASLDAVILDRSATHLSVTAIVEFPKVKLEFRLFYHYLDVEPMGPMIDGDIIIQGTFADPNYGPALAVVECNINNDDGFTEIVHVTPAKMMITPATNPEESEDSSTKFLIPITVRPEYQNKPLRIKIFCQRASEIHYDAEEEDLNELTSLEKRHEYFLTNLVIPSNGASLPDEAKAGIKEEDPESIASYHNSLVIKNIRIATDYDEVISLQHEGLELSCTLVTPTGIVSDQDHIWKFHVLAEFGPPNEPGLEDLMFIKCLKSLGTLPSIPFFEVLHDYDLSKPEDDCSVYIAIKLGISPKFKKLVMISSEMAHEESLELWIATVNGIFRLAPPELDKSVNGHCGLLLSYESTIPDTVPLRNEGLTDGLRTPPPPMRRQSVATKSAKTEDSKFGDDEKSSPGSEEDDDEDVYIDEEEIIRELQEHLDELEQEKKALLQANQELQKRAVVLMTREKALQGQSNPTGTSSNVARPPATEGGTSGAEGTGGGDPNNPNNAGAGGQPQEQNLEKEKQYQDVLIQIIEERKKLNKQLKEFDQLALDLQTRLDDKEFKAKSIATSFKQFKKEILQKAENSRTGHPISKHQIQLIENSELKHEEDLEKIRLRNISLKSLQKKLEKTLRQREQLAEGLHMIDFEQLKIENQTLNEKIEERNEELSKLKRKKTLTVQILTHIREKLRYVEMSNKTLQGKLNILEAYITSKRNSVTVKKLDRDESRTENKEYKAKQGFASSDLLLLDYEKRKYLTQEVEANIMELKNRYDLLSKQLQFTNTSNFFSSSLSGSGGGSRGGAGLIGGGTRGASNPNAAGLQVSRGMNGLKTGAFDGTKPNPGNYKLSR